jgi:hypothetical protein
LARGRAVDGQVGEAVVLDDGAVVLVAEKNDGDQRVRTEERDALVEEGLVQPGQLRGLGPLRGDGGSDVERGLRIDEKAVPGFQLASKLQLFYPRAPCS